VPVSSDDTSTPDDDAERFAAAVDGGGHDAPDGDLDADPDLEREVALARRLGALGDALDPEPQARERARQRLLAALARETRPDGAADGPSRAS
jgi:hypothetical protein